MRIAFIALFSLFGWTQGYYNHPLHEAAEQGLLDKVKRLVELRKVDLEVEGYQDKTPLMSAAEGPYKIPSQVQERLEVAKYLIEKGAKINGQDNQGSTPLHYATRSIDPGNVAMVKYLVEQGAKVKTRNNERNTPLLGAAKNGQFESVKYLVENGANVTTKMYLGTTALHAAASSGKVEIVKYLVEKGAQIDALDYSNISSLIKAAEANSMETVQYLVEKGAVVLTKQSYRLLTSCAVNNNVKMLKYFIGLGVPVTAPEGVISALHEAAKSYKTLELIQILVENGADVNAKDYTRRTPAHYAAENGNWEVLKYLYENNANMHVHNIYDITPFAYARRKGFSELQTWSSQQKLKILLEFFQSIISLYSSPQKQ